MSKSLVLAGVALEVAEHLPDTDFDLTRAEWRYMIVNKALEIIEAENITLDTDDVDEIVTGYLSREESLS